MRMSTWAGRLAYLADIERRYGLTYEFAPSESNAFLQKVEELAIADDRPVWQERRSRLLADHCDLTDWYRDFVLGRFGDRSVDQ